MSGKCFLERPTSGLISSMNHNTSMQNTLELERLGCPVFWDRGEVELYLSSHCGISAPCRRCIAGSRVITFYVYLWLCQDYGPCGTTSRLEARHGSPRRRRKFNSAVRPCTTTLGSRPPSTEHSNSS